MKPLISVLIAEPSEIICEGLKALLQTSGKYNVLAPLHDATSVTERLAAARPDLLIINPSLLTSPRQQLAAIAQTRPTMPVMALVYQYIESSTLALFQHSIDIRCTYSTLISQMQSAMESGERRAENEDRKAENYELSERETDVLVLVAKGLSSKEIADKLNISVHTVNSHRKNITHKTGIKSVAGLAVYAMIHNLM